MLLFGRFCCVSFGFAIFPAPRYSRCPRSVFHWAAPHRTAPHRTGERRKSARKSTSSCQRSPRLSCSGGGVLGGGVLGGGVLGGGVLQFAVTTSLAVVYATCMNHWRRNVSFTRVPISKFISDLFILCINKLIRVVSFTYTCVLFY